MIKWYKEFFDGVANNYWDGAVTPEQTLAESSFLAGLFPVGAGLLDVPSGSGRLAKIMLEHGFAITAVDISEENILKLNSTCNNPGLTTVVADMTEYQSPMSFRGAYCFGNSFNYLDHRSMKKFIGNVSKSLQKNCLFVAHSGAIAESLLLNLEERTWYETAGLVTLLEHTYDPLKSLLITDYTFIQTDGSKQTKQIYHYLYTLAETRRMFADNGLKLRDVFADTLGSDYRVGCPECYLVVEKL